jgi:hypothetical protein
MNTTTRPTPDVTVTITRKRHADGSNDASAACDCGWVGNIYTSTPTIHNNHLAQHEASQHLRRAHDGLRGRIKSV